MKKLRLDFQNEWIDLELDDKNVIRSVYSTRLGAGCDEFYDIGPDGNETVYKVGDPYPKPSDSGGTKYKEELNLKKLPQECVVVHPVDRQPIVVRRGVVGFWQSGLRKDDVNKFNEDLGVSKTQAMAMLHGSMYGFHIPAADPDEWTDEDWDKYMAKERRFP